MRRFTLLLLLGVAGWPAPALAQLELQAFLGSSVSAPSPLSIGQRGQPDLDFTTHWATRPWLDTWYYAGRVGIWKGNRGMFTLSRGFRRGKLSYAVGTGSVIAFPINRVRGQSLESGRGFLGGYFLLGASVMASATRCFPLPSGFFLSLDTRLSASYLRVPVSSGHAAVPNGASHLHAGLGYQPQRPTAAPTEAAP